MSMKHHAPKPQTIAQLVQLHVQTHRPFRRWSPSRQYLLDKLSELGQDHPTPGTARAVADVARRWPVSPSTRHQLLATLSGVARDTCDRGAAPISPDDVQGALRILKLEHAARAAQPRSVRITDAELARLARYWSGRAPPETLPFLIDVPMRSGELCALRWADVNRALRLVTLRDRKNGYTDQVPLLGRAPELLDAFDTSGPRVLPISQDGLSATFRRAARRAGLAHLRLHDLRHEGISRLIARGWSIAHVQAVSGHRSWTTLQRYTAITPADLLALDART